MITQEMASTLPSDENAPEDRGERGGTDFDIDHLKKR